MAGATRSSDGKGVCRPGVEPGSTAWKATMLTVTPPTHLLIMHVNKLFSKFELKCKGLQSCKLCNIREYKNYEYKDILWMVPGH